MMPGTAAEQLLFTQAGGGSALVASIDFANDVYTVNGSTVVLSDIIDQPSRRSASGLSCKRTAVQGGGGSAAVVRAIGVLLDVLLAADWTIVFEYETTTDYTSGSNGSIFLLQVLKLTSPSGTYNNGGWDGDLQCYLQPGSGAAYLFEEMLVTPFTIRFVQSDEGMSGGTTPEIGKVAFSRAITHVATAQDGVFDGVPDGADDSTGVSQTFDDVVLADTNWAIAVATPAYIRSMMVYAPRKANSELVTLTS